MATPKDPRPGGPEGTRPPPPAASVNPQQLSRARPESTVTLMVQSGQAPGGLTPKPASDAAPAPKPGLWSRAWATMKSWF
jgi:hypothetical protein